MPLMIGKRTSEPFPPERATALAQLGMTELVVYFVAGMPVITSSAGSP